MKDRFSILYGYNREEFIKLKHKQEEHKQTEHKQTEHNRIIIIEPRGLYIENFKKEFKTSKDVILVSKMITNKSQTLRSILYKQGNEYTITQNDDYDKREEVFCTTLTSLINQYEIQTVTSFVIDFPVKEINEMLSEFCMYSHLIASVKIRTNIFFDISDNFLRVVKQPIDNVFDYYENRNLDMDLPTICLYVTDYPSTNINKSKLLQMVKQYEIEMLSNGELIPFTKIDEHIDEVRNASKFSIQQIPDQLQTILKAKYYDIIIQFNTKYFLSKPFFQLMYPLKENLLYIDRNLDIIYGSGKTMYKLYEMMYSDEFKEYMKTKRLSKPKLYNLFERRYFYDYLVTKFRTEPAIPQN